MLYVDLEIGYANALVLQKCVACVGNIVPHYCYCSRISMQPLLNNGTINLTCIAHGEICEISQDKQAAKTEYNNMSGLNRQT